ncbi:DNA adenine methylase [Achromobacter xylosoxidans]|nr:DNA adenine methylase [Achromobacter xylosoxidans]MCH4595779.1 DNA adenine methylase [Achromobacter xylosoxidans]CUJ09956.1 Adenine-specific DNA methylase [Achromobacter xylosoxidans]CUR72534.1 Adenine-specific DNA methylase [Achromobacter xylosoxidans]
MGHKGKLLPILGEILRFESAGARRVADPFCGSGAVSWFLAHSTDKAVFSSDLQSFAAARAAAVVERTTKLDADSIIRSWFQAARKIVNLVAVQFPNAKRSIQPDLTTAADIRPLVLRSRKFCQAVLPPLLGRIGGEFPMTVAYGGHYFSPMQALELDALRRTIPKSSLQSNACIAALVDAASRCAASPGHTAQPFQPTETAGRFIVEAWNRNVWHATAQALRSIADTHAQVRGRAVVGDYQDCIRRLEPGDLVFADPPYSDVHYSRFYHVLETLVRGAEVTVSGVGRYPPLSERPGSSFSRKGEAYDAARALIEVCASREVGLVLTFPSEGASNGLTIADFVRLGADKFSSIHVHEVRSTFSTLGGSTASRGGRKDCLESIACFRI